jgi:hypothetical protein
MPEGALIAKEIYQGAAHLRDTAPLAFGERDDERRRDYLLKQAPADVSSSAGDRQNMQTDGSMEGHLR